MNPIVALDDGLTPVKNFLTKQGCKIIDIDQAKHQRLDAVVLSGIEKNFLGMEDIMTDAPVFSAQGMTPEEIWHSIQQITKMKH